MTITLELAAIIFLGVLSGWLVHKLGNAAKVAKYWYAMSKAYEDSIAMTYKILADVMKDAADDFPQAVDAIGDDFTIRMEEALAQAQVQAEMDNV